MRARLALVFFPAAVFGFVWACTSPPPVDDTVPDSGLDSSGADDVSTDVPIDTNVPLPETSGYTCALPSDNLDPVGLCLQQQVLLE